MKTRLLLAAIGAALVLALPATASADLLTSFHDATEGSQQPVPGGRGDVSFGSDENPCRYYSFDAKRQSGYAGLTDNAETWEQIGRLPTLLPPGTFWEKKGEEEGYFPTEKDAVKAIPAGVTSVPRGARALTTSRWTAAPTGGLTPYQPETTLACSAAYTMDYAGPWSPAFQKGAEVTAVCKDAQQSTPFVQWIQGLEKETPELFVRLSTEKALMQALRGALKEGASKSAKTVLANTFKALWGGKPGDLLGFGLVEKLLGAAVDSYLKEVAAQIEPMSNAVWDYSVNGGNFWSYWAPSKSTMTARELSINIVSANPAASQAMVRVACTSTPTLQGNVLNLSPHAEEGLRFREDVHGPAYYGTPLSGAKAATATASDLTADGADQSEAVAETVIGRGKEKLDVATGPGNDEVFGALGDDVLRAGSGNDKLIGGPGSDELLAGSGQDLLVDHSASPNAFVGGDGTDRIDARHEGDQSDTISCDTGEDIVLADPQDDISGTCEHVFFTLDEAPHDLDDALKEPRNWPR